MKKIIYKVLAVLLIVCTCFSTTVFADEAEPTITILLSDPSENIIISDTEVSLYKIAEFTNYKKHTFIVEEPFEQIMSEMDFSSTEVGCTMENSKIILAYIQENDISPIAVSISDESGIAKFENIEEGIYLVDIADSEEYLVDAFLVEALLYVDGEYHFDVEASPKMEYVPVPTEPEVSTTPEPEVSTTPEPEVSTTPEPEVSTTPELTPNSNGSQSTNTPAATIPVEPGGKLPQTGQLKWPVPVLAISGVTLMVLGYADYCLHRKDDDED